MTLDQLHVPVGTHAPKNKVNEVLPALRSPACLPVSKFFAVRIPFFVRICAPILISSQKCTFTIYTWFETSTCYSASTWTHAIH